MTESKLEDKDIQNKINKAYNNNFKISLSMIPIFDVNNQKITNGFLKIIKYLSNKDKKIRNKLNRSKVSVKIRQLGKNSRIQWINFLKIVDYAYKHKIFIWIACVFKDDLDLEYNYYKKIRNNYNNVGITLSTSHYSVSKKVNQILKNKGHIRLVKGIYKGNVKNWKTVTELYKSNALKLVNSGYYHCLATHDFEILKIVKNYNTKLFNANIETSFFFDSMSYIKKNLNIIENNRKSFYIYFGSKLGYIKQHLYTYFFQSNFLRNVPLLYRKILYHI